MPARSLLLCTSAKPASRDERAHRLRLPGAVLERERAHARAAGELRRERADQHRARRLPRTAPPRARDGGSRAPALRARPRRRREGWRGSRRTRRPRPRAGRRRASAPAGRAERRSRAPARAPASLRSLPVSSRSGRSSLSASATAPLPVPRSSTLQAARQLQARLDEQLGLGPGHQRAAIGLQLAGGGSGGARRCRRPARDRPRAGATASWKARTAGPSTHSSSSISRRSRGTRRT